MNEVTKSIVFASHNHALLFLSYKQRYIYVALSTLVCLLMKLVPDNIHEQWDGEQHSSITEKPFHPV